MRKIACSTALALLLSPAAVFAQDVAPSAPAPAKHLDKAADAMKKVGDFGKPAPAAPTETPTAKTTEKATPTPTTDKAVTPAPEKADKTMAGEKPATPSAEKSGAVVKEDPAKPAEKSDADKKDAAAAAPSAEKPTAAPVGAGQEGSAADKLKSTMMDKAAKQAGGSALEKAKPTPTLPTSPGGTR